MLGNKVFFVLFVACWSCSMTVSGVPAPKGPLRNHITGGFKGIQTRNSRSDLDCSQFSSDYDVLYHFSFLIMINPIINNWGKSIATMDTNGTLVIDLQLHGESVVPLSIFCLKNLGDLYIYNTPFPNGIIPDNLEKLKHLYSLTIQSSPIMNMTERLGTLSSLSHLNLYNCSLTHLPDLSDIPRLYSLDLSLNQLSTIDGLTDVNSLDLSDNLFTDIPTLKTPNRLYYLAMNNNPVKNMLAITSHTGLQYLYLRNTTLSSIPATIDRLQQLEYLDLSYNKLFYLPTNILNLAKLIYFNIQNNSFSSADIQVYQTRFNTSHPNMILVS
jgi:Leucine-rich repeat (LRR) protein